jgi:hypothetical protein
MRRKVVQRRRTAWAGAGPEVGPARFAPRGVVEFGDEVRASAGVVEAVGDRSPKHGARGAGNVTECGPGSLQKRLEQGKQEAAAS